ncbi:hypothetical protein [Marinobacter sp.]|uniref:hypothetical protein n=1 Tax=Marinobacter sp. TaxID=50741 RepID=UPI0019CC2CAD|nr:hypothetical protein [Marinobacter sp.]MBC7193910.1 hypothetical protein [Marinobacter sp.]
MVEERHTVTPGRLTYHDDRIVVDIEPAEGFDQERDYILVEHKRSPNPYLRGSSSREGYELLFGRMPAWATFPENWARWVRDERVQGSAIDHILRRVPTAKEDVEYAMRKGSKGNIISAWRAVASHCEAATGKKMDGIGGNGSWTAVRAMPIRIAQRLGGWRPPVPRPVYEERNAVLVVSPDTVGRYRSIA